MISYDNLLQVCAKYKVPNFYVGGAIPHDKLVNARVHYPIPIQERIVALIDTSLFGDNALLGTLLGDTITGLAIGTSGLYWRNATKATARTYLPWEEFAQVPIVPGGVMSQWVEIGQGNVFELGQTPFSNEGVASLLAEIQQLIFSPLPVATPSTVGGPQGERLEEPTYEVLASVRNTVDLSTNDALEAAQQFIARKGYDILRREDTHLVARRQQETQSGLRTAILVVEAQPQLDGGVRLRIMGNDRDSVDSNRVGWARWADSLPKKPNASESTEEGARIVDY